MSADSSAMDITDLVLDLAVKAIKASQESFDPGVDRDAAVRGD
jgi:hypothetical protein